MMLDKATPTPLAVDRAHDTQTELAVAATLPAPAFVDAPPLPAPDHDGAADIPHEERDHGRERSGNERDELGEADTGLASEASMDGPALPKPRLDGVADEVERARVFEALFQRVAEPRRLGRYVVLDSLGQGGMGVVLRAYDRELDRPVALKVLHQGLADRHTQRLRREAQAMAKLSHPNVVQVYEVGEVEGQTFVAMELVKGRTLREWMEQEPRPDWRECVRVFVQVGAGLAAAHERGLVHRDFKPGNAIVDERGRPRVLDFGLARLGGEADDEPSTIERARTDAHEGVSLEASLTDTGAVLGTPAYMPPEQMDGQQVDARSDQFSFCVSLYEALYGERPFAGRTMEMLMAALRAAEIRPAPSSTSVPEALRKLLLRGLSTDPAERWPSMEALLERLGALVAPRRRRWLALAVSVGLLGLGGGLGVTQTMEWLSRCTGARGQLERVWDEARREEVRTAILGTGLSYAAGTWERVEPQLDGYAEAWAAEHTEVCEATRVRNEQSEEEMSLRMGCLRERRLHLRATVDELSRADATVVENAVGAVTSLPGLERCADVEALRADVPPPEDPAVAEQVAALDEQLVEAKAKEEAGKYEEGLRLADEVVAKSEALDYEPLMARAWLRQGRLRNDAGDYEGAVKALRLAYSAAMARRMTAETAEASAMLVFVVGDKLVRLEEARGWAEHAEPLSRAAGTDEARASYLHDLGNVAHWQGKYEEARALYEQALAIWERALGPDHPHVAASLERLGRVASAQAKYEEARVSYERALAIREKALGPDHPHVATSLDDLGGAMRMQLKDEETRLVEEARASYKRALAIREKALRPDHPDVATSLSGLGFLAFWQDEYDEARELYERALVIQEKALGPDHPNVADTLGVLGMVRWKQGDYEHARELYERVLAIREKTLGPDHPHVATALNYLGDVVRLQGDYEHARELLERALAIREKTLGPDHPNVAAALLTLGLVARSLGRYDDARGFHERAVAIREKTSGPDHPGVALSLTHVGIALLDLAKPADALAPLERAVTIGTTTQWVYYWPLARTQFALARALWTAPTSKGRDRPRARTLAAQARATYAAAGEASKADLADVEAWLAEHRLP
jgi:tetratricopeptide (TPR) repeat protein/predicted Ser/Thr protein kinase